MKKVVVTGGSGLLGTWVVKEFVNKGYEVLNVDVKKPAESITETKIVDLTNLGEVYGVLQGAYAVIHLAAIPVAYSHPNEVTFENNVMSTYNILEAASGLGIKKVVLASSESSYGIVFAPERFDPQYFPVDEDHPQLPEDAYGLSKIVNEETAKMFYRKSGMQVVSFRLGNVIAPEMYKKFPSFIHDSKQRDRILWSYIDTRDAAEACRLAVEKDGLGAVELNLAADNTSMDIPSRELMTLEFPAVKDIRREINGYETLLSNEKAKKLLHWQPQHNWRDHV
ncbi:NAD-dependent epimerase/dehydratase family protein [Alkalicoccus halolimnae]|uniref:NAD(P)-dependent oxidoreductase n=1 Tax=Alkalicoccus halolimnae TaxID=1667239 RepID=A0A5C7F9W0_9BACI|nr:NAD(P)-dependent oxidoreductase [Alkalicoccus halolimnae]TXF82552.1 NAD(P)-dependent oxidoreductase [Alkalicoccus halolimnae]